MRGLVHEVDALVADLPKTGEPRFDRVTLMLPVRSLKLPTS